MKNSNIHKLSACELTMLAATTATSLTNGLNPEEINQVVNFLNLLCANVNAIKCQHQFCLNCKNKKDDCKSPHF